MIYDGLAREGLEQGRWPRWNASFHVWHPATPLQSLLGRPRCHHNISAGRWILHGLEKLISWEGMNFIPAKSRSKVQNYRFHKEKVLFVLSRAWARSLTVVSGAQQLDHHQGSLRLGYWIAWQVQQVDLPAWCLNPGTLASAGI